LNKQKKHILILSSWYPNRDQPFLGNFVQNQAVLLSSIYHVSVVYLHADKNCDAIQLEIVEKDFLKEIRVYYPKKSNPISSYFIALKALKKGLKVLDEVDLIHGHVMLPKGFLFLKTKAILRKPLIITEHSSVFLQKSKNEMGLRNRLMLQRLLKKADALIAVSDVLKVALLPFFPNEPIQTIGNPIKTDLFRLKPTIQSKIYSFLHVSTLDRVNKNPLGILSAVEMLLKNADVNFCLRIVSDENYADFETLVKQKGLEKHIKFYGPCSSEELVEHYHKSHAFIMFSNYETFSIVIGEAWSCGLPVISTPVGIASHLSNELGIQVNINDSLSLAHAMERIIKGEQFDPIAIRNHALQFSEEQILEKIKNLYSRYLG
jgi:glycosyltransferase involved in cell wall biosynthesis